MIVNNEIHFAGNRTGILLIHGLTGTPSEMRDVARGLNNAGYTVHCVQLAGHCGNVDDLIATGWRDWYQSVIDAAENLRREVDNLFVGGLSMGAVLALKYASDYPVSGVLVYGATFRADGWSVPTLPRVAASLLLPVATWLGIGRRRMVNEAEPYGIRNETLRRRIARTMLSGDSAGAGLPGNPWPSLNEMFQLSRNVRRSLWKVVAPCLILHAKDDDVAHHRNGKLVRDRVSGPAELVLLENSYHMITIDNDRGELLARSLTFVARHLRDVPRVVPTLHQPATGGALL